MSAATEVRSRGERLRDGSGNAAPVGLVAPRSDLVLDRQPAKLRLLQPVGCGAEFRKARDMISMGWNAF